MKSCKLSNSGLLKPLNLSKVSMPRHVLQDENVNIPWMCIYISFPSSRIKTLPIELETKN